MKGKIAALALTMTVQGKRQTKGKIAALALAMTSRRDNTPTINQSDHSI